MQLGRRPPVQELHLELDIRSLLGLVWLDPESGVQPDRLHMRQVQIRPEHRRRGGDLEHELDASARGNHVAEREARGHESHDFLVLLARVAVHETDRVAAALPAATNKLSTWP